MQNTSTHCIPHSYGHHGEIDLLSIDMDGNDYWVWKAISEIEPRVVIIEYNAALGAEKSRTIPYNPEFVRHSGSLYHGASLRALTNLAQDKGYCLIGCEGSGINAFFLRQDITQEFFLELSVADAFFPNARLIMHGISTEAQYECIRNLPFVEV